MPIPRYQNMVPWLHPLLSMHSLCQGAANADKIRLAKEMIRKKVAELKKKALEMLISAPFAELWWGWLGVVATKIHTTWLPLWFIIRPLS